MAPPALRQNRTPSARARAASEVFQTPQETPRALKRSRQAARALIDLSAVDEGGSEDQEDEPEAAEPNESESEEEEEEEEELTEDRRMNLQVYETTWRCLNDRQKVLSVESHILTGHDSVYDKVRQWAVLDCMKHASSINRITFKVHGKDQPMRSHWQSDIKSAVDFEKVRKKALQVKEDDGYKDVYIDAIVHLKKDTPPPETPAASISKKKKKRVRLTATQRQERTADDELEDAVVAGDYSLQLRVRWTCGVTSCPNNQASNGGYCYWPTSNSKEGHFPLNASAVKAWSSEIKEEEATDDKPSPKVFEMLVSAKSRLLSHSHNHRARSANNQPVQGGGGGHAPVYNNFFGVGASEVLAQQRQRQSAEPPSSAPTETPPLEVLNALFRYCKDSVAWRGFEDDVDAIEVALHTHGYDIDGIKGLTVVDWHEMGLKRGQREKFINSVRKFKCIRRESG